MENKEKKLKNVSDSVVMNENLNQMVDCPVCQGSDKECTFCGGLGKVSKRKKENFKK
jgi:hypothetical protein